MELEQRVLEARYYKIKKYLQTWNIEIKQLNLRLRQQQLQSEEDSKWLQKEESNLKKRLSITNSFGSDEGSTGDQSNELEAAASSGNNSAVGGHNISATSEAVPSPQISATSGSASGRSLVVKVKIKHNLWNFAKD